ncbi:MAG: EamA-like transporter family protein [Proteobacteria bacterium]|nr:EamA-like transporter family protein [Pseudomonadota bacterium]
MYPLYLLLALTIGLIVPLQSTINNQLKIVIGGSTVIAALISFGVGTLSLLLISLLTQQKWSSFTQLGQATWWQLTGGAMGALFVFGTTLLAPRIGVAVMLAVIICGQILASLLFDRFGILGLPVRELSTPRLLGAALVLVGVLLVSFGDRLR